MCQPFQDTRRLHIGLSRGIKAFHAGVEAAGNIKINGIGPRSILHSSFTFGPRGILRLPMRNDVLVYTRHAMVYPAAVWRGYPLSRMNCYKQFRCVTSLRRWPAADDDFSALPNEARLVLSSCAIEDIWMRVIQNFATCNPDV